MDPNLTAPIFINATLNQPPESLLSSSSVVALIGILGTVIGGGLTYFTSISTENKKRKEKILQEKKQLYSKFKGEVMLGDQIFGTRSVIITRYYWNKAQDDLYHNVPGLAQQYEKLNEYELKIGDYLHNLNEIIGFIQVTFTLNPARDTLIEAIFSNINNFSELNNKLDEQFNKMVDDIRNCIVLDSELDILKDRSYQNLGNFVKNVLTPSMIALENNLRQEITQ